jgi:hypothetical protein
MRNGLIEFAGGTKWWYINDKRHREDGAAVEYANGTKRWYINDKEFTKEEWKDWVINESNLPTNEITRILLLNS